MYGGLRSIEAMLLTTVHTQAPFSVRYSMNHDLSFMVSTIANHCPVVYVTHCMGELSARDVRCMSAWSWIYNYRSMVQAPVLSSRATDLNWMLTVYIFFAHRLAGEKNEKKNKNKKNKKKTHVAGSLNHTAASTDMKFHVVYLLCVPQLTSFSLATFLPCHKTSSVFCLLFLMETNLSQNTCPGRIKRQQWVLSVLYISGPSLFSSQQVEQQTTQQCHVE